MSDWTTPTIMIDADDRGFPSSPQWSISRGGNARSGLSRQTARTTRSSTDTKEAPNLIRFATNQVDTKC
jgi:hypothetical protein